jgi:hypothetical protein
MALATGTFKIETMKAILADGTPITETMVIKDVESIMTLGPIFGVRVKRGPGNFVTYYFPFNSIVKMVLDWQEDVPNTDSDILGY